MTAIKSLVKKNTFYDSLTLMRISKKASFEIKDVSQAVVVMASNVNKDMLESVGLLTDEIKDAGPNDLVISIEIENTTDADSAIETIEKMFVESRASKTTETLPRNIESAYEQLSDANMAVISVPGEYATLETKKALDLGLNVLLFSDNVSLEDELELKKIARDKDLLMMGPGCGTSIINGAALGFANVVERGPIGIIAAAGTGVQEVTTLIHQAGSGISHAIGTGGRDLYDDIGGIMMSKGVQMLEKDAETKVIVLISKPPGPKTQKTILETNFSKPVVVCFMGGDLSDLKDTNVLPTETLEDAAMTAVALVKNEVP